MSLTFADVVRSHIQTTLSNLYTSLPATVTEVGINGTQVVVSAQPFPNRVEIDGSVIEEDVLPDIPVVFPAGGGSLISFPIAVGDTILLVYSMRAIEEFIASDGSKPETSFDKRLHDLSDAIAIPGLFTSTNSPEVSTTDVQLRNGIGGTESDISITPDGNINVNSDNVTINATNVNLNATDVTFTATNVLVKATAKIELGDGATEALVKGDAFMTLFNGHFHPTGVGPSGPPTVLMATPTHLSTISKVL